jgi:type IV secretory pathway TrbF-like protein
MTFTSFLSSERHDNPHLAASQALRSEYDRLVQSNQMLRHSMFATAGALLLTSALSLYVARKPHIVPYVVEVGKTGEVMGVAQPLASDQSITEAVVRFQAGAVHRRRAQRAG